MMSEDERAEAGGNQAEQVNAPSEPAAAGQSDSATGNARYQRPPITRFRRYVQFGFLGLIILIGIQFTYWVATLMAGNDPIVPRPPGVEGFLPISALISLKYWILSGTFNTIHPASLVLFLIILITGILMKKGFCSWVCPVGLLSEYLAKVRGFLFKKPINYKGCWDYPLRSIKYLLLLFFLNAIVLGMDEGKLRAFIYSDYNEVADIKMGLFFAPPSTTATVVLIILALLSIWIPYFWCRYLCPYGALLGFISIFSPANIKRNPISCIDCKLCTKACPAAITVHRMGEVSSDECHACMACVEACPVPDTLALAVKAKKGQNFRKFPGRQISWKTYAITIVLLFVIGTTVARLFGYWQNDISNSEYKVHLQDLDNPKYTHTGGMAGGGE